MIPRVRLFVSSGFLFLLPPPLQSGTERKVPAASAGNNYNNIEICSGWRLPLKISSALMIVVRPSSCSRALSALKSMARGQPCRLMSTTAPASVKNIYCIGRNYVEHVYELGNELPKEEPVVFIKSLSSLRGLEGATAFAESGRIHHELELVVQIAEQIPLNSHVESWDVIGSLALGLDLTLRDKQSALRAKGLPWTLSKSFQGSSILGPLVPLSEFYEQGGKDFSPDSLSFELRVNDDVRQKASVAQMIFPVPHLLTFLATYQPLEPGDLVYTGTPKGVNTMVKGDEFAMSWLTNDDKRGYSGTYEGVL